MSFCGLNTQHINMLAWGKTKWYFQEKNKHCLDKKIQKLLQISLVLNCLSSCSVFFEIPSNNTYEWWKDQHWNHYEDYYCCKIKQVRSLAHLILNLIPFNTNEVAQRLDVIGTDCLHNATPDMLQESSNEMFMPPIAQVFPHLNSLTQFSLNSKHQVHFFKI